MLIGLLVQNPDLAPLVPPLDALDQNKLLDLAYLRIGQNLFWLGRGLTTDNFWNSTVAQMMLRPLKIIDVNDIADKRDCRKPLPTHSTIAFDSLLQLRQEELIARDRTHGLSSEERRELWTLNQRAYQKINLTA